MKTIIVPTDFTATADAALNYARAISDFLNARIRLIHVHSETADEQDVLAKLDAQITMSGLSRDIITGEMVKGDYLKMIPKLVNDEQFGLIVFGTHGKKGVQHLVGSFAMRSGRSLMVCGLLSTAPYHSEDLLIAVSINLFI